MLPRTTAFVSSLLLLGSIAALPAAGAAQSNQVGLNAHNAEGAVLDMAADLGLGWIRVDGNWFQMEPRPGEYRWVLDDAVRGATDRGVKVFITLAYTPDWVPRVPRTRTDASGSNDEPLTDAEWRSFVAAAVTHYRAMGVTHFGIWNEPNLEHFFEGDVDAYIDKILIPGSEAVRGACGDCLVLGPDLAHVGDYHEFLEPIMRRAGDRFDIVAHHNYHNFPELGATLFSGDSFVHALEERRFAFTRPSMREILDAAGWTGEVWITETGYQTARIGDAGDEADQATYLRLVLEEQLARDWWTNTFFYEAVDCGVDIPGCDIDGFGLTRPDRTGPRSFPDNFRTKPAYDGLRSFIASHPEIGDTGSPPPVDDRLLVDVARRDDIVVDGTLSDWAGVPAVAVHTWDGDAPYGGADDISASARFAFRDGTLFVAIDVTDADHDNGRGDDTLWAGDSLQLAVDVLGDGGTGYGVDDHEFTVALGEGATRVHREHGDGVAPNAVVTRTATRTVYEVALSATSLGGARIVDGATLRASLVINDADGEGRDGWLELTGGIARGKVPGEFAQLRFVGASTPPGAGDGGAGGPDGGSGVADSGTGADAGGPDGGAAGDGAVGTPPGAPGPAAGGCSTAAPG
ncbi:MAG: hypothetical protein JRH11_01600, partial [Deltaproteobacteria bacterium]|nr:hypothetical protein [Deltaproteobacteria bacterium]